jgi:hypothetical protein
LNIRNCNFSECEIPSGKIGGGLYLIVNADGQSYLSEILFNDCKAGYGGGLYIDFIES